MEVKKIQNHLVGMLKEIIKVLEDNNINYFLVGGTLLGAVRHGGFIPWDDDIDIGMMREDYDKLLLNWEKISPKNFRLESQNIDDNYPYFFAKIYDKNTTLIEDTKKEIKKGVFIDIFPFDEISDDPKQSKKEIKKVERLREIYNVRTGYYNKSRDSILISLVVRPLLILLYTNKRIKKKIMKIVNKNKGTNTCAAFFGAWIEKDIYKKAWILDTRYMYFENIYCKVPNKYKEVLRKTYGDYMEIPGEEDRKSHHNYKYINLNKPYYIEGEEE